MADNNQTNSIAALENVINEKDTIQELLNAKLIKQKELKKIRTKQSEEIKKLGNAELVKGNCDAAITFYTQALCLCPESKRVLWSKLFQKRATAYSKLNNYEKCVKECDKALELVPMYKKALSRRSRAHSKLENFKLALEDITVVLILDDSKKKSSDLIFAYSVIESLAKKNMDNYTKKMVFNLPSKSYIENYLKSFCDDPFDEQFPQSLVKSGVIVGLELALQCLRDKNYEKIDEACKEELNKTSNSLIRRTLSLNLLATFSALRGNYDNAIEHLTTIIETSRVSNKLMINSLIKRALVYHQQDQVEKSIEDLKRAETIDPNSSDIFYHRAEIYLIEKNSEKAFEEYKKAIALNPKCILYNISNCYAHYISNDMEIEIYIETLKEFLVKYPNHVECNILYSKVLVQKGTPETFEEADIILKKLHEIYPENAIILVQRASIALTWKNSRKNAFNFLKQALKIDSKCREAYNLLLKLHMIKDQLKATFRCSNKIIPLCTSKKELLRMFSIRDSTKVQLEVIKRFRLYCDGFVYYF